MKENELLQRITILPEVCHGKPTIRGSRYTVEGILEYLNGGDSIEEILEEFEDVEREDVEACLAYAGRRK
jgi:uncharacterized protein (DUF433 family)